MKKNGFVVSAVLYPLLVLFLALIMGLLSMTDTRKRILDKMKLEISDSIFDEATCSCDTILNKLNYLIKNGTGGGGNSTGTIQLNIKAVETAAEIPQVWNKIGDVAVITSTEITHYYISSTPPLLPQEGMIWVVQDAASNIYLQSDYTNIGISYIMQYENNKWVLKESYLYNGAWQRLYFVDLEDSLYYKGEDYTYTYDYTGNVQTFRAPFSGIYLFEVWGAEGGSATYATTLQGGKGGYMKGAYYLQNGETLYITVGGKGYDVTANGSTGKCTDNGKGYNGGGVGGFSVGNNAASGGGGATHIAFKSGLLKDIDASNILVAAGGGGGAASHYAYPSYSGTGGAGGGFYGQGGNVSNNTFYSQGGGASQTVGGHYYNRETTPGINGGYGIGGSRPNGTKCEGNVSSYPGGGGGYYGGSAGSQGPSGGGSGYYGQLFNYQNIRLESKIGENFGHGQVKIQLKTIEILSDEEIAVLKNKTSIGEYIYEYDYTGKPQEFIAPETGYYKFELWGASGGNATYSATVAGGKGGYSVGTYKANKGDKLYVYVGGQGATIVTNSGNYTYEYNGNGFNGGGTGSYGIANHAASGGGGATHIANKKGVLTQLTSSSILVVAGGGGGSNSHSSYPSYSGAGGAGGGLTGKNGSPFNGIYYAYGTGGSQTQGGVFVNSASTGPANRVGGFGYGGGNESLAASNGISGGGGGYYGGSAGYHGAAGGGSGYIGGVSSNSKYDVTAKTVDGATSFPTPFSGNEVGHTGNGYVKITYLGT